MSHVFLYQLLVPSIRWICDSIPKHGVYVDLGELWWCHAMCSFTILLGCWMVTSMLHIKWIKRKGHHYTPSCQLFEHTPLRSKIYEHSTSSEIFIPPQKKNKTNTANTHWTHPKPACFLHFAIESSSSASRLFEGSTLVMKAINANVRSVFCSRDQWFFWLASASGVRSALKNRRTHFCSKCFCWVFWVKSPGDLWVGPKKSGFFLVRWWLENLEHMDAYG